MRTKVALLVGVIALIAASSAPAAQGKVVTMEAGGIPLETGHTFQAYSSNFVISTLWGNMGCTWGNAWSGTPKAGDLITEVVENQADPAVLNGFSGGLACLLNGTTPFTASSEATGPIELHGDGGGELPIKVSVVYSDPKNPCVYSAVLNLTPQAGYNTATFSGYGSAPGCGPAEFNGNLNFHMEDGTPVTFSYS